MNESDVEALIKDRLRADRVPGLSIAVVGSDGLRWQRGFGVTDLISRVPVEPRTPYLWFSMTKIVTATAAMRLAGTGAVDLDAAVNDYLPALAVVAQPRPITLRHLLSHSSGLANPVPIRWVRAADTPLPDPHSWVERLLARHRRLRFVPGTRAAYSNLGYLVVGEVIAAVTGVPFTTHVHDQVLRPLGMAHTGFTYADTGNEPPATGYQPLAAPLIPLLRAVLPRGIVDGRQGRYAAYRPFYVLGAAYGGLIGGVADAARIVHLHLDDGTFGASRLLPAGLAAQMRQVTPRGGRLDVGLGWYRPAGPDPGYVEHAGGGSGFWSVMRLYPAAGLGMVVMGNTTRYDHEPILAAVSRWSRSR